MPNSAQVELLDSFFGEEGIYFTTIQDDEVLNLGTKILYLERAISQNCQDFLQSLDKLYNPNLDVKAKAANIEVIRALKSINDCCFNNQVKYGQYGTRAALDHFFGSLGVINPIDFKTAIQKIINQRITVLGDQYPEKSPFQKSARAAVEANIVGETGWRVELDLPVAQRQVRQVGVDVIQVLNGALTDEQYQQLSDEVRRVVADNPDATRRIIQDCGATFANIQALPAQELLQLLNHSLAVKNLVSHIHFDDLLALDPGVRTELLNYPPDNIAVLLYDAQVPLTNLLALDPVVRAELFNCSGAVYFLINDAQVPFQDLLVIDPDVRIELLRNVEIVVVLINELQVPFEQLSGLSVSQLNTVFNAPESEEAQVILPNLRLGPSP